MDTFANSEYPEENNPAPEASFDAPQEPQNEAPQEPQNEVPQEHQSEPQSGTYHAAGTGRRESPYANSPYMTGQPRPYQNQYQYQPQTQPPEKREKKPRRSGKSPWKTVIAAVLVVALVASGTLMLTICMAKSLGCILPILAKILKLDPAIMASPLITTITDAFSILVYFNFALWYLPGRLG